MPRKSGSGKKPHFKSKEAKRKYEAYKHIHVTGCGGKRKRKRKK